MIIFTGDGIPDTRMLTRAADRRIIQAFMDFGDVAAKASLGPASFERLRWDSGFS